MNLQAKQRVREMVAAGPIVPPAPADELIIEIVSNTGVSSVTLRPAEVSRLRSRFGRGPGFEAWVAARIRDAMVTFGGG